MLVLTVVPREEAAAKAPGILSRAEPFGKVRAIFERLKLRFRIRVVIGRMGPRVSFGDAQIRQEERHGLRRHTRPSVGVDRELIFLDSLFLTGFLDQLRRQNSRLSMSHHPAGDITAEDVHDDVEIEVAPFDGALELGDIPGPHLVGRGRQEFGLGVMRTRHLIAPLTGLSDRLQEPVHRAHRAQVATPLKKLRKDASGRLVHEFLGVERRHDAFFFTA